MLNIPIKETGDLFEAHELNSIVQEINKVYDIFDPGTILVLDGSTRDYRDSGIRVFPNTDFGGVRMHLEPSEFGVKPSITFHPTSIYIEGPSNGAVVNVADDFLTLYGPDVSIETTGSISILADNQIKLYANVLDIGEVADLIHLGERADWVYLGKEAEYINMGKNSTYIDIGSNMYGDISIGDSIWGDIIIGDTDSCGLVVSDGSQGSQIYASIADTKLISLSYATILIGDPDQSQEIRVGDQNSWVKLYYDGYDENIDIESENIFMSSTYRISLSTQGPLDIQVDELTAQVDSDIILRADGGTLSLETGSEDITILSNSSSIKFGLKLIDEVEDDWEPEIIIDSPHVTFTGAYLTLPRWVQTENIGSTTSTQLGEDGNLLATTVGGHIVKVTKSEIKDWLGIND